MAELYLPSGYSELTPEEKAKLCNGMGAKNSLISRWIPNTMYGLDVEEAGNIHDYMYHVGRTWQDKEFADDKFRWNMFELIDNKGGWLASFRRRRALKYYEAVLYFGDDAFWAGGLREEKK